VKRKGYHREVGSKDAMGQAVKVWHPSALWKPTERSLPHVAAKRPEQEVLHRLRAS
jgi:hypothetical protein